MFSLLILSGCVNHSKKTNSQNTPSQFKNVNAMPLSSPLAKEQEIMKELTGKAASNIPTQAQLKNKPLPTQHYFAGLRAYESKNYIKAIKHFNTVLKKYPQAPEVKLSFVAKAKIYNEMGLEEPAQLNLKMAQSSKASQKANRFSKNKNDLTGSTQIRR